MAVAGLAAGAIKGYSEAKNAKEEAKLVRKQEKEQINERAREAKKLMSQQKSSFLKSGIYFNSGTPLDILNETYNFMNEDIEAIQYNSNTKVKNLMRQGRTAFFSSLLDGMAKGASSYASAGGFDNSSTTTSNIDKVKLSGGRINTADIV